MGSAGTAKIEARGSISKTAHSHLWQVGTGFHPRAQPVLWALVLLYGVLGLPQNMVARFQEQAPL